MLDESKLKADELRLSKVFQILEDQNLTFKVLVQIISNLSGIEVLQDKDNSVERLKKTHKSYNNILNTIEQHSSYIPIASLQQLKEFAKRVIAKCQSYPQQDSKQKSEEVEDVLYYVRAISNTAKAILWEINEYEKKTEYSVVLPKTESDSYHQIAENDNTQENKSLYFSRQLSDEDIEESITTMESWFDRFGEDNMYKTLLILEEQSKNDSSN